MSWKCQICKKDYGGQESDPPPLCREKPDCKKKGEFACKWEADEVPGWKFTSGDLKKPSKSAAALQDLNELLKKAGNIYSCQIGTVVGGQLVKKGKKIKGLKDENARIDIQSPPKGAYNVQYQIGDDSVANVIFTEQDAQEDVFENLRESLKQTKKATSPNVGKK